jgi:hypothetical protein
LVGEVKGGDHFGDLGVDSEDNIKMELKDTGCGYMDLIYLASKWHLTITVMKFRFSNRWVIS